MGAPHSGPRRPARPLRPARLHRLPRALPHLVARAAGRLPRGHRVARRGTRTDRGAPHRRRVATRSRLARRGMGEKPSREALDAVVGEMPAAFWSKDYHSLWLSSAALARAGGDLDVPGGVVERDAGGEPTGILREESAWRFRERYVTVSEDEWVTATREGLKLAATRGVGAIHDKDGWLGAPAIFGRLHESVGLSLRVWQSLPAEQAGHLEELGLRSRLGDDYLRLGYLKAFMDGTLGSQTRGCSTGPASGSRAVKTRPADPFRGGGGLADRRPRDRRSRQPRGARCLRGDEGGVAATRAAAADRARAVPRSRGRPPVRGARCRLLRPVQPRAFRSRPGRALLGRSARGHVRVPFPRRERRRRRQRLGRAGRGARTPRRDQRRRAAHDRRAAAVASRGIGHGRTGAPRRTVAPAWLAGDERRRGKLLPGFLADLVVLDRDPVAVPPDELPALRVVATMVGGRWVHNAPPWD